MTNLIDFSQFADIGDTLPDALLVIDPKGLIVVLNRAARKFFPNAKIGDYLKDHVQDDSDALNRLLKSWRRAATSSPGTLHALAACPDEPPTPLRCEGCAITQGHGIVLRCRTKEEAAKPFAVLNEEIKKLQHANHELRHDREYLARRVEERTRIIRENERRLHGILEALAEAVICFSREGVILSTNAAADNLFGYPPGTLSGMYMNALLPSAWNDGALISEHDSHGLEARAQDKGGVEFPVELKVRELFLQDEVAFTALITDITERKAYLHSLKYQAEHDALTGLYNRRYFQAELDRLTMPDNRRVGALHTVMFMDLDNFKYVNDEFGHSDGDQVLKDVSELLLLNTRNNDLLARLGGDEFVLLLRGAEDNEIDVIAERMRASLEAYTYSGSAGRADIGCSIGIAKLYEHMHADQALGQAEFACRQAKNRGRNCIWRFTDHDVAAAATGAHDMGWLRRVKRALRNDLFVLYTQPIMHTSQNCLAASEVLIRLADEGDELIMPNAFLPAAERFGLMPEIDRWVIRHAFALAAREDGILSINLSGNTLEQGKIADYVADQLQIHGIAAERLIFEITETAAVANIAVTATELRKLQALGCRTALDDFGTGMSSFAYLRELPVDWVKIDGRFVRDLATNPIDQAMVKAMNEIAHTLGKQTVAEFVEDADALTILRELGIDFAQGYYLGRPAAISQLKCCPPERDRAPLIDTADIGILL